MPDAVVCRDCANHPMFPYVPDWDGRPDEVPERLIRGTLTRRARLRTRAPGGALNALADGEAQSPEVARACAAWRDQADALAAQLRAEGWEVRVYGVPAYSTLGWSNWIGGDPLLNTFIGYPEGELARMLFHELAHQVLQPVERDGGGAHGHAPSARQRPSPGGSGCSFGQHPRQYARASPRRLSRTVKMVPMSGLPQRQHFIGRPRAWPARSHGGRRRRAVRCRCGEDAQ